MLGVIVHDFNPKTEAGGLYSKSLPSKKRGGKIKTNKL